MDEAFLRARLAGPDPQAGTLAESVLPTLGDDPEFFVGDLTPAAVLVGIVTGPAAGVLLTKRTASLRRHAGQVSFPGGRIDPDDGSAEAAALRETQEEIGLAPEQVEILGRLPDYATVSGFRMTPVLALIAPGFVATPSPHEVEAVFCLPLEILLNPQSPTRQSAEYRGKMREYWVWPHDTHLIWGATAAILVHLAKRLA